jgi:hypothetical protein
MQLNTFLADGFVELQLKPTHVPFKLVCYWEELLEKYCTASEFERQRGFYAYWLLCMLW